MSGKATGKTYLVVGGNGFLGRYITEQLLERGEKEVRVFDMRKSWDDPRVTFFLGNIRNEADLLPAMRGVTTVFNTVSPPHGGTFQQYYGVNVEGTRTLLKVASESGVKEFVHTSSSSVVFEGKDIFGADETAEYAKKHIDPYTHTKEIAERDVLAQNGKNGMLTVAIRPSGIFGPRDAQIWPAMIEAARSGKWKYQIGAGKNKQDFTFVENVAYGHILASDKIKPGSGIDGQAFFVTNDDPLSPWDMAKLVYKTVGVGEPYIILPYFLMLYLSMLVDIIVWILSLVGVTIHPTFSYFRVVSVAANRTFNISKAKRVLGYKPKVSMQEGLDRTSKWFKEQFAKEKEAKQTKKA